MVVGERARMLWSVSLSLSPALYVSVRRLTVEVQDIGKRIKRIFGLKMSCLLRFTIRVYVGMVSMTIRKYRCSRLSLRHAFYDDTSPFFMPRLRRLNFLLPCFRSNTLVFFISVSNKVRLPKAS